MQNSRLLRYLLVGGVAYVAEMGVLFVLAQWLPGVGAVAISFWVGFAVAFVLQKIVAFKNHQRSRAVLLRQLGAYSALVLWNYLFTLGVVAALGLHVPVLLARTLAILFITAWNFMFYGKIFAQVTD